VQIEDAIDLRGLDILVVHLYVKNSRFVKYPDHWDAKEAGRLVA